MMRKGLMYGLAILLAVLPLLGSFSKEAAAASTRVAVIKELKGTVKVKKAGGSKEFTAFAKMSLNEGDVLAVGSGGSAVLQFANGTSEDDKMTVASNAKLTFSKLSNKKGTTTKVSMWSGSAWVDVKSITNKEDQFTLETPTAVMGVRGTHLLVTVNPDTGATNLMVAAGVVQTTSTAGGGQSQTVYPTQNALITKDGADGSDVTIAPADLETLMQQGDAEIVKAIIQGAKDITAENEQYVQRYENGEVPKEIGGTSADLERFKNNTQNLLGALVTKAVETGLISQDRMNQLIDEASQQTGFKVDVTKSSLQLTEAEKAKQEAQRKREEAQAKLEAERKAKEEAERKKLEDTIRKLEEERKAKEKAAREAAEAKQKQAQEKYESQLSEAEKNRLKEEAEKRKAETKAAQSSASPTPSTSPSPSPGPSSSQPPVLSGNANLSGLTITEGNSTLALSPAFSSSTVSYTATLPTNATQVKVAPVVADSGKATFTINGLSLSGGFVIVDVSTGPSKVIDVVVTAENGTTKTYSVTLTRPGSNNADLSDLIVRLSGSSDNLIPFGQPDLPDNTYTITVPNTTGEVIVKPTVSNASATEKVAGGQSITSGNEVTIPLVSSGGSVSVTSITLIVTAENRTVKSYTIFITRQASILNSSVSIPGIEIFNPEQAVYNLAPVSSETELLPLDFGVPFFNRDIVVKNNGVQVEQHSEGPTDRFDVPLVSGANVIEISVTRTVLIEVASLPDFRMLGVAQSGTPITQTYTINVTRGASNNADLSGLTLSHGNIAFSSEQTSYEVVVGNGVQSLSVKPVAAHSKATVVVNGTLVNSGSDSDPISLGIGSNIITIVVTAEDGTTKTYSVNVTRQAQVSTTDILSFNIGESQVNDTIIDHEQHYVFIEVPKGSSLLLPANFELSPGAVAYTWNGVNDWNERASGEDQSFDGPVVYRISAEDGMFTDWLVYVHYPSEIHGIQIAYGNGGYLDALPLGDNEYVAHVNADIGVNKFYIYPYGSYFMSKVYQLVDGDRVWLENGLANLPVDGETEELVEDWYDFIVSVDGGGGEITEYELHLWVGDGMPEPFEGFSVVTDNDLLSGEHYSDPSSLFVDIGEEYEGTIRFKPNALPEGVQLDAMLLSWYGDIEEVLQLEEGYYSIESGRTEQTVYAVLSKDGRKWTYSIAFLTGDPELYGITLLDQNEEYLGNMQFNGPDSIVNYSVSEELLGQNLYLSPVIYNDSEYTRLRINGEEMPFNYTRAPLKLVEFSQNASIPVELTTPSGVTLHYTINLNAGPPPVEQAVSSVMFQYDEGHVAVSRTSEYDYTAFLDEVSMSQGLRVTITPVSADYMQKVFIGDPALHNELAVNAGVADVAWIDLETGWNDLTIFSFDDNGIQVGQETKVSLWKPDGDQDQPSSLALDIESLEWTEEEGAYIAGVESSSLMSYDSVLDTSSETVYLTVGLLEPTSTIESILQMFPDNHVEEIDYDAQTGKTGPISNVMNSQVLIRVTESSDNGGRSVVYTIRLNDMPSLASARVHFVAGYGEVEANKDGDVFTSIVAPYNLKPTDPPSLPLGLKLSPAIEGQQVEVFQGGLEIEPTNGEYLFTYYGTPTIFDVVVLSLNGVATKSYTVEVRPYALNDASVSNLQIGNNYLGSSSHGRDFTYVLTADETTVNDVAFTIAGNANASVTLDDSNVGVVYDSVNHNYDFTVDAATSKVIKIVVTPEVGDPETYRIIIVRDNTPYNLVLNGMDVNDGQNAYSSYGNFNPSLRQYIYTLSNGDSLDKEVDSITANPVFGNNSDGVHVTMMTNDGDEIGPDGNGQFSIDRLHFAWNNIFFNVNAPDNIYNQKYQLNIWRSGQFEVWDAEGAIPITTFDYDKSYENEVNVTVPFDTTRLKFKTLLNSPSASIEAKYLNGNDQQLFSEFGDETFSNELTFTGTEQTVVLWIKQPGIQTYIYTIHLQREPQPESLDSMALLVGGAPQVLSRTNLTVSGAVGSRSVYVHYDAQLAGGTTSATFNLDLGDVGNGPVFTSGGTVYEMNGEQTTSVSLDRFVANEVTVSGLTEGLHQFKLIYESETGNHYEVQFNITVLGISA